jgi:hypothetical protein
VERIPEEGVRDFSEAIMRSQSRTHLLEETSPPPQASLLQIELPTMVAHLPIVAPAAAAARVYRPIILPRSDITQSDMTNREDNNTQDKYNLDSIVHHCAWKNSTSSQKFATHWLVVQYNAIQEGSEVERTKLIDTPYLSCNHVQLHVA